MTVKRRLLRHKFKTGWDVDPSVVRSVVLKRRREFLTGQEQLRSSIRRNYLNKEDYSQSRSLRRKLNVKWGFTIIPVFLVPCVPSVPFLCSCSLFRSYVPFLFLVPFRSLWLNAVCWFLVYSLVIIVRLSCLLILLPFREYPDTIEII